MKDQGNNGYLSGNRMVSYPLADEDDVPAERRAVFGCIVDAMIYISNPDDVRSPFLCDIWSDGALHLTLAMGSRRTQIVVAGSSAGGVQEFPVVNGREDWGFYTLVFSSEGIRDLGELSRANAICPSSAIAGSSPAEEGLYFAPRAVCRASMGLRSIRVFDGVRPRDEGPHFVLRGNVQLRPGNNMLLEDPYGDDEEAQGVSISAVPGAGMGVVPCSCSGESVIKSPLKCEDGHVRLFNDTCYDLEPSTRNGVRPGVLKIHAKCTACCTCEMYESVVNDRLAELFKAVKGVKESIAAMVSKYEDNVGIFNNRIEKPVREDIEVGMAGEAISAKLSTRVGNNGCKGAMDRSMFKAFIRNHSFVPVSVDVDEMNAGEASIRDVNIRTNTGFKKQSSGATSATFILPAGGVAVVAFVAIYDSQGDFVRKATSRSVTASMRFVVTYNGAVVGRYDLSASS